MTLDRERELRETHDDLMSAFDELGLKLNPDEIAHRLRNLQSRAEEHDLPLDRYQRRRLRHAFFGDQPMD
jgi:hypothetical protein